MNQDQIKGSIKDAAGKVQRKAGEMVGSEEHQAKGMEKQAEGKTQKTAGNIKETVKDAFRK